MGLSGLGKFITTCFHYTLSAGKGVILLLCIWLIKAMAFTLVNTISFTREQSYKPWSFM